MGPVYGELHDAVVDATRDLDVARILDLGTGTGEDARRLLAVHETAAVVCVDANRAMLDAAARTLPPERTTLLYARLEEPLPAGPFDLVVSVLAVHHLSAAGKVDLFARIGDVLAPGGRFVLGDAVWDPQEPRPHKSVPQRFVESLRREGVAETVRKIARRARRGVLGGYVDYDERDLLADQVAWLQNAGLSARVFWEKELCAVVSAEKPRADRRPVPAAAASASANGATHHAGA
jgi:tRNA (cmo5U34)-methyltransferase